jgi:alpha-methylacyl-CoA racemase
MADPSHSSGGPLKGARVVEFVGIGPGPYCAMLLSDLGAEVLRIDRADGNGWPNPAHDRGRATLALDIKSDEGRAMCREAVRNADILIEGFRPGVMERLGLGPDELLALNPRLIYGRMTGWGQQGPLAKAAGHDINYIALSGALAPMGRKGQLPDPPLNLAGDFGGGSLFLALGLVAALWERERSGLGQVVDAAIVDGAASLMAMFAGAPSAPWLSLERGANLLSGAAPFYRCYACADGLEISIGPIEPHFYRSLLTSIGAPLDLLERQYDQSKWAEDSERLAEIFRVRPRAQWGALLEGTDACYAPVLTLEEAEAHPHVRSRQTYLRHDGVAQPAPAPRFSRTPAEIAASQDGFAVLEKWTSTPRGARQNRS